MTTELEELNKIRQSIAKALDDLSEGVFEEGELHGGVLDLIQQIINLPGEHYTDENCLGIIFTAINSWNRLVD